MRKVPEPLYSKVLSLSTEFVDAVERDDATAQEDALVCLGELRAQHLLSGTPDPFLTETLADFTKDALKAVLLYREAIEQCAGFPDEPLHTKQIGLASRLLELEENEEAKILLPKALHAARTLGDTDAAGEAEGLLKGAAK